MNLHTLLLDREAAGRPVTVGLIGAGKFGTMFSRRRGSPAVCMWSRSRTSMSNAHAAS
jgi:predicted homoserine dehydrogenase-like protein